MYAASLFGAKIQDFSKLIAVKLLFPKFPSVFDFFPRNENGRFRVIIILAQGGAAVMCLFLARNKLEPVGLSEKRKKKITPFCW